MIWQLGQLVASLAAILVVTLLVWKLGLGSDIRLRDEDEARRLAGDALCGFNAVDVVLDRAGIGALLRDATGRVMLLRRHGVHFAARLLDSHAGIRLDRNFLTIATAEKSFGTVTLDLGTQAQVWAGSLRRLGG
jgi:hypothetical protein